MRVGRHGGGRSVHRRDDPGAGGGELHRGGRLNLPAAARPRAHYSYTLGPLIGIDAAIREYMQALGALAADSVELTADEQAAYASLAAASAYVKALGDIKAAHTALYNNRDNVLSAAMPAQIKIPAQDAYKAFQDYQAAVAVPKAKWNKPGGSSGKLQRGPMPWD